MHTKEIKMLLMHHCQLELTFIFIKTVELQIKLLSKQNINQNPISHI